jgi:4-hydroxy-3-methylbut-2-enyl diphosphate reductase
LDDYVVVGSEDDLEKLRATGKRKFGIVSQTTQQVGKVEQIVGKIRKMDCVDDVAFVNTICQPTRDRQVAVGDLADQVDLMIVIGGFNSSNTKKLVQVCDEKGVEAHHVESNTKKLVQVCDEKGVEAHHVEASSQLDKKWFTSKKHVGITAGTSTPEYIINDVHSAILAIAREMDKLETQPMH